jgi:DNA-binding NarL/FixJ family response regulator
MPKRVLIVDDAIFMRNMIKDIFAGSGFQVVGEAANGKEAISLARRTRPDIVLMDVQMPEMDGIAATRQLAGESEAEALRVLVLTTFEMDEYVFEALRAGASGFLLKRTPADELINAVRVVAGGESLLSPSITRRLIREFVSRPAAVADKTVAIRLDQLTERELEVLTHIAHGLSNNEIAEKIFVSEGTVKTHIRRVFAKLDVRDRTQAVIFAYNAGLVRPEGPA